MWSNNVKFNLLHHLRFIKQAESICNINADTQKEWENFLYSI